MDMPFADVSDETFLELFADFEWEETASGEWTFGQRWFLDGVGWMFEPLIERQDADPEEAQLNAALHFGYETYGQDGPPAPLLQPDPLDYPLYDDYDDPRDIDY